MNFKAAICPSCGGQLQVPDDRDSVKCMYCGSDIVVREAIQKASGPDPANFLGLAEIALNEGKYNKALNFCNKALELDYKNPEAWLLAGRCNGHLKYDLQSTYGEYGEMISDFKKSLNYASDNLKELYKCKIVTAINEFVSSYEKFSWENIGSRGLFLTDFEEHVAELEFALSLKPDDTTTLKNIVELYKIELEECYERYNPDLSEGNSSEADNWNRQIVELTEKMNPWIDNIKKTDPSYTGPVIIKKKPEIPPPVVTSPVVKKIHSYGEKVGLAILIICVIVLFIAICYLWVFYPDLATNHS